MKKFIIILVAVFIAFGTAWWFGFIPKSVLTFWKSDVQEQRTDSLEYRKFPYQEIINYKLNQVEIEDTAAYYAGGALNYENGEPVIILNKFSLGRAFNDSTNLGAFRQRFEFLNSEMRKQFTLYYQFTRKLNDVFHLQNLNRKDEILIRKYDDISARLAVVLLAREIYLETGWDYIFQDYLAFYLDAVKENKFVPQKGNISVNEAEFIINELAKNWQKTIEMSSAKTELKRAGNLAGKYDELSENMLRSVIAPFFAYDINGQKINFLDYLKQKIELTTLELISVNSQEIQ